MGVLCVESNSTSGSLASSRRRPTSRRRRPGPSVRPAHLQPGRPVLGVGSVWAAAHLVVTLSDVEEEFESPQYCEQGKYESLPHLWAWSSAGAARSKGRCPRSACSRYPPIRRRVFCLGARGERLHDACVGRQLCLRAATGAPALTPAGAGHGQDLFV